MFFVGEKENVFVAVLYLLDLIGKVNTEENFEFEKTPITQTEFDFNTNTKSSVSFCFGCNLDLRIITNLFFTGTGELK